MRELKGEWRDLFNGFSVALDLKKLLVGFIGLALTFVIGIAGPFFLACLKKPELWTNFTNGYYDNCHELYHSAWIVILAFPLLWKIVTIAVIYLLLTVVWAYCGGVITRIAAVNLTKDEGLELSKALSFAGKKYLAYFSPWVVCILGFFFFWFWNFLGGLAGRIPYAGELLVAIFLPLAILSVFIMVFIAIGSIFGSTMFFPTISVEGSDSFDALSRSFSYLYAKPWHFIWYHLVAAAYGFVTTLFVWWFGKMMIAFAFCAGIVGMGSKFGDLLNLISLGHGFSCCAMPSSGTGTAIPVTYSIAAFILAFWLIIVIGFIAAYAVSYCFSAQTIIYLLLRKKVDEIDVKEIYEEETEESGISQPVPPTPPAAEGAKPEEKPQA